LNAPKIGECPLSPAGKNFGETLEAPNVYANSPFFAIPSNPVQKAVLDTDIEKGLFSVFGRLRDRF
jgi:hypothetical protein